MTTAELTRPGQAGRGATDEARDVYVTLTVAGQLCGIPVFAVRDILGPQAITRIPLAPPEVAGSLNLRGRIVTAIDLSTRLGVGSASSATSMSVVVEHQGEHYSLLVDSVGEVLRLEASAREQNPPTLGAEWRSFSTGVFRLAGQLLVVLDVAAVLDL
jgi:purine-binding chemotaxis protein CheW